MSELTQVGVVGELKDGAMKMVKVKGQEVLLARVGEKYYATHNRCPHMGGLLSGGKLKGTIVTCPRHGSQLDITNGTVVRQPSGPLLTYNLVIEDDKILIRI